MSNKAVKLAEAVASATTRRGFLGRLAKTAGTAAAVMAGVLVTDSATAKGKQHLWCCVYEIDGFPGEFLYACLERCPRRYGNGFVAGTLWAKRKINDCSECGF